MQNISVCLIGKNEANVLEKCLQALVPYPWEIVFTDTGSTDETKAIATRYTKNVYDFEWIGDFSAARNFCAEKASNDWILHNHEKELEDFADYYYTLGFFEYALGNIQKAIECYKTALSSPSCTNELARGDGSHYNLGLLYLACDDLANATSHLEQCLGFKDAKEKLGLVYYQYGKQLYDAGMFQEAMPFIQKASEYLEH